MNVFVFIVVVATALACVVVSDVDLRGNKGRDEYCGDNVKWTLNSEGELRISGKGEMYDYQDLNPPWFDSSSTITSIIIENGVTHIGNRAFSSCNKVVNVTFPRENDVTIGSNAFQFCSSLPSISLPESVISVGASTFVGCNELVNVKISKNIKSIGEDAFSSCTSLSSVDVDEDNIVYKSIDGILFTRGNNSTLVYFPQAKYLDSYSIPDGVVAIGPHAIYLNSGLKRVTIPASMRSVGIGPFYACTKLEYIDVDKSNPVYESEDGVLLTKENVTLVQFPRLKNSGTSYTVPAGVLFIEDYAFWVNPLTYVSLPSGLVSIGAHAFHHSSYLQNVQNIPNTLVSIGDYAFAECDELRSIVIPDSVTFVGNNAFRDSSQLTSVSIGNGVESIGKSTFSGCSSLSTVTIGTGVKSIGQGAFESCRSLKGITIPDNVISIEDCAFSETAIRNLVIGNGVETIGEFAFGASSISSIVFGSNLKSIGPRAFSDCDYLESVIIPDNVVSIGDLCFSSSSLERIEIGKGLKVLGADVFGSCYDLNSIDVNKENPYFASIDGVLFYHNFSSLLWYPQGNMSESYIIPDGVKSVGDNAFSNCDRLKSIILPDGLESIGKKAFRNCIFKDIQIPDTVSYLGDSAFANCKDLTSIIIPSSVVSIGNDAFDSCTDLSVVYYLGSSNISSNVFESTSLNVVCVPPDYNFQQFGGALVTSNVSECQQFQKLFNHCYEGFFVDGDFKQRVRLNASVFENQTRDCLERHCDNETGPIAWSFCNTTDEITRLCLNDKCIEEKNIPEKDMWSVVIEVDEVKSDNINITEIAVTASELTGIDVDDLSVGVEYDDNGFATRVIIYVKAKDLADVIVEAIKTMDQSQGCEYGTLCRSKSVIVRSPESKYIDSTHSQGWILQMVVTIVLVSMMI